MKEGSLAIYSELLSFIGNQEQVGTPVWRAWVKLLPTPEVCWGSSLSYSFVPFSSFLLPALQASAFLSTLPSPSAEKI